MMHLETDAERAERLRRETEALEEVGAEESLRGHLEHLLRMGHFSDSRDTRDIYRSLTRVAAAQAKACAIALAQEDAANSTAPDADLVFTHQDAVACMGAVATLLELGGKLVEKLVIADLHEREVTQ